MIPLSIGADVWALIIIESIFFTAIIVMIINNEEPKKKKVKTEHPEKAAPKRKLKYGRDYIICDECNARIPADSKICPYCGGDPYDDLYYCQPDGSFSWDEDDDN